MEWGFQSVCKNLFERYIYYVIALVLLCLGHIYTLFQVLAVFIVIHYQSSADSALEKPAAASSLRFI
jgi:hypothetical protein